MNNQPIHIWRKHKTLNQLLGKKGVLVAWTNIYAAPPRFTHQTPYIAGIVTYGKNQKVPLEIVDVDAQQLEVGMPIEIVIRRVGKAAPDEVLTYGIKGKPIA